MKSPESSSHKANSLRVFVTGATGFVGSAVVQELLRSGHRVLGLARTDAAAHALIAAGAEVHRGDTDDAACLRSGAALTDGVIHTAFNHDFSKFLSSCEADRHVINALGTALIGTSKPLIITSAIGVVHAAPGQPATEEDPADEAKISPRSATEEAAFAFVAHGVNVSLVRLPQVHDRTKQGLITELIKLAKQKRVSAFVGSGNHRWSAAHISDVARLYRLALEKNKPSAVYHPVAEEGIPLKDIARMIGEGLNVSISSISPEQVPGHFGWLSKFAVRDMSASSTKTQSLLNWIPSGPGLMEDLAHANY